MEGATGDPGSAGLRRPEKRPRSSSSPRTWVFCWGLGFGAELGWDWLGAAPPAARAVAPAPGEEL